MGTQDDEVRGLESATISATERASPSSPQPSLTHGAAFGRYLVLERLGGGGMGVVYSAYDPELDRKIAVKILRPEAVQDQSRLRREAQAMARLQHPNVITVFDAGMVGERAFVAMELVDGTTLSQWLEERSRSWREIIDVFLHAGRGLAAAHAMGLVHRDFKPANVLVGRDGRVRVVDFGLARAVDATSAAVDANGATVEAGSAAVDVAARSPSSPSVPMLGETITRTGTLLGTPTYMSPEQFLGAATSARSDQFSFCVALYRALYGERPFAGDDVKTLAVEVGRGRPPTPPKDSRVPTWVRDVVLRGLSVDPERRWPSMEALLAELARDPAKARRRWLVGAGAVLLLLSLALTYRGLERRHSLVCAGAAEKLAGVWDPARKRAVQAAFAATGKPYAADAFAGVVHALDGFAESWVAMHTEACEATRVRREQSEELLDLRMECLGQRLQEANARIDLLASADAKIVERSVQMTSSLSNLSACSDVAALRMPVRPPSDPAIRARVDKLRKSLARVDALDAAGRYKDALPLAAPLVAEAAALKYRPIEADTLYMLGWLQRKSGDAATAAKTLEDAAMAARAGRDLRREVAAWAALVKVAEVQARYQQAHEWARLGFSAYEALGVTDERSLSILLESLGAVVFREGKYDEALDYARRGLALSEKVYGPDGMKTSFWLGSMSRTLGAMGRNVEAEALARRELAISEKRLGPQHPEVGDALHVLGDQLQGQGRYDEALQYERRALALWEKTLGPNHIRLVELLGAIGSILVLQGKYDEALAIQRRALAISEQTGPPGHPRIGYTLAYIGDALRRQGKEEEAIDYLRRALANLEKALGAEHPDLVAVLTDIGLVELQRHAPARALPSLTRALEIGERQSGDPADVAGARFGLARALWETGRDRPRAHRLAVEARAGYVGVGARSRTDLAEVDTWLEQHRP